MTIEPAMWCGLSSLHVQPRRAAPQTRHPQFIRDTDAARHEKFERLRKQLGLTQTEAARRAKLPGRAYWHDIVTGRRANVTLAVLDNLAAALRCSPRGLIRPSATSTGDPPDA